MTKTVFIAVILVVQGLCAAYFVSEIAISVLGLPVPPIDWQLREFLEIGAALGLVSAVIVSAILLQKSEARSQAAEARLRAASGAFVDHLEVQFGEWGLTPAERDVAMFALKGLSTSEIAGLRDTSEGTVKAQTNAIYRKAGVSSRAQLVSLFIEDLIDPETAGQFKPAR